MGRCTANTDAWLGDGMALVLWRPPRRLVFLDIFDRGQQVRRRRRRNRTSCSLKINAQDKCTLIAVQDVMPYQLMPIRNIVVMQTVQSGFSFVWSISFNGCHMNHWRVAERGRGRCQDRSFASGSSLLVRSSSACGGDSRSGTHSPPACPYPLASLDVICSPGLLVRLASPDTLSPSLFHGSSIRMNLEQHLHNFSRCLAYRCAVKSHPAVDNGRPRHLLASP